MENLKKLGKATESKRENCWKLFFRILGALMFLFAIYLPMRSLVDMGLEEMPMSRTRVGFMLGGFFLVWGGGSFGILTNNIGIAISNFLNKYTK